MRKSKARQNLPERQEFGAPYHLAFFVFWLFAVTVMALKALSAPNFGGDTAAYLLPIHNFLNGFGYARVPGSMLETHVPPGFGILALPVYFLVQDIELSGNLTVLLAYALSLILVFRESLRFAAPPHALLAVLYVATLPSFMQSSLVSLSDVPFTLFLLGAFFALARFLMARSGFMPLGLLLGALFGAGMMVRPEMMFVAFPGYLFLIGKLVLLIKSKDSLSAKSLFAALCASLGVLFVFVAPYGLFLWRELGFFTITGKAGPNIEWMQSPLLNLGYGPSSQTEMKGLPGFFHFLVVDNGAAFLRNIARHSWIVFNKTVVDLAPPLKIFFGLALVIALLSWKAVFSRENFRAPVTLPVMLALMASVLPMIPSAMLFVYDRLLMPYHTVLLPPLAWGTVELLRILGREISRPLNPVPLILLAAAMLFTGHFRSYHEIFAKPHSYFGTRAGAKWLYENVSGITPGSVMVTGRANPAYIRLIGGRPATSSEMPLKILGNQRPEELGEKMSKEGAVYLLVSAIMIDKYPLLKSLWDDPSMAASLGLEIFHLDPAKSFQIYTLKK